MLPDTRFLGAVLAEPLGLELHMTVACGTASEGALSNAERERYRSLAMTARARSWLLGRAALKQLRARVDARADVDDLDFPNSRFSLTHSSDVALAVADTSGQLAGIGVDLEVDTTIRPEAARFFLTVREQNWLRGQPRERWSHDLLRLWCVKEALYKSNPANAGTVLGDYELLEPANACGKAFTRAGRPMEYSSWCASRTSIALSVYR